MMKNKKGIEPVIATVLLIVITIAAVALIIAFVVPFVQKQLGTADLCYKANGIQLDPEATCYKTIKIQGEPDKTEVRVKVDWNTQSEAFTLKDLVVSISNGTKTVSVDWTETLSAPGESATQVFPNVLITGTITEISIAPVVAPPKGSVLTCEQRSIAPVVCPIA